MSIGYVALGRRKLYACQQMGKKVKVVRVVDVTEMGKLGGKATAANRTPEERKAVALKAGKARWDKYYREHPEKARPKKRAKKK
jgi:hypothetical protein